jgi:hypothetical protein
VVSGVPTLTIPAREKENVYVKPLSRARDIRSLQGITEEEQGPLVRQPAPAAKLARVLHHAAQELWDACTHTSSADMWEEARAIASRILAAAPAE